MKIYNLSNLICYKKFNKMIIIIFCIGKFYLIDAGFMLRGGLITPYRGVRYHLKE